MSKCIFHTYHDDMVVKNIIEFCKFEKSKLQELDWDIPFDQLKLAYPQPGSHCPNWKRHGTEMTW